MHGVCTYAWGLKGQSRLAGSLPTYLTRNPYMGPLIWSGLVWFGLIAQLGDKVAMAMASPSPSPNPRPRLLIRYQGMSRVADTCRAPKACNSPKLPAPPLPFAHFLIRPYPDICWTDFGHLSSLSHPRWEMKNPPLPKWPGIMSLRAHLSCVFLTY
jgi:hypothetical protein